MAKAMRNMHLGTYLCAIQDIVGYAEWDAKDAMKRFATEQLQLIGSDGEVSKDYHKWDCEGCGTTFRYLRHAGRKLNFALEECPNCTAVYEEESGEDESDAKGSDEDTVDAQVKVEDSA